MDVVATTRARLKVSAGGGNCGSCRRGCPVTAISFMTQPVLGERPCIDARDLSSARLPAVLCSYNVMVTILA